MTSTPEPDELPDETPGGSAISDPEVFNNPERVDDDDLHDDQAEEADE
jgi:hypothetical protein